MDKISFTNSQGDALVGVLHTPAAPTSSCVIISHGFTSDKDRGRHIRLAEALAEEGIAAFRIDFGGSGESAEREITVQAEVDDLTSALQEMKKKGYTKIGLHGESLGGLVSLLSWTPEVQTIGLWAPVTSNKVFIALDDEQKASLASKGHYVRVKGEKRFIIPQQCLDEREAVNQEELLKRISVPVFILHGVNDSIISIEESRRALQLLPAGSHLEELPDWEHGDMPMENHLDTVIPATVSWFKNHL